MVLCQLQQSCYGEKTTEKLKMWEIVGDRLSLISLSLMPVHGDFMALLCQGRQHLTRRS